MLQLYFSPSPLSLMVKLRRLSVASIRVSLFPCEASREFALRASALRAWHGQQVFQRVSCRMICSSGVLVMYE